MEKTPTWDAQSEPKETIHKYTELRFGGSGIVSFEALMPGQSVKAKDKDGVIHTETIKHLVFANGSGYFVYAIEPRGRKGIAHVVVDARLKNKKGKAR